MAQVGQDVTYVSVLWQGLPGYSDLGGLTLPDEKWSFTGAERVRELGKASTFLTLAYR